MRTTADPGSGPASHTGPSSSGTSRGVLRALATPAAVTGGLTELAWVGAHTLLYPLGTWAEVLRPDQRRRPGEQPPGVRALFAADPLAARTPVLLVHGLVDNRSVFALMRRGLRRRGFAQVCTWNYSPLLGDVALGARDLGEHVERICAQTGHDRVHLVGHSLGGLIARHYVQLQGGGRRVESLTTLGTPHEGSVLAHLLPTPMVRQLRPGSALLQELAAPAPRWDTRTTAVYSDLDQLVLPTRNGRCDHPDLRARNVLVRGVGHMTLPYHRRVVDEVAATLAGLRPAPAQAPVAAAVA